MDKAKAVLPIAGLPAIIIKSLFWKPEVTLSKSIIPDGTPITPPGLAAIPSNLLTVSAKIGSICE